MPIAPIHHSVMLAFILPGGYEWIILLILGLLLFGRRLPEVGRSIGRSIVEFKKGIKGIEDEIDEETSKPARPPQRLTERPAEPTIRAERDEPVATRAETQPPIHDERA